MSDRPLAYRAYQQLADAYAARIDTKPHNAFYDRPAIFSLWPDVRGMRVLDIGCGPGAYAEALVARGATVVACDMSDRMLARAAERLATSIEAGQVELRCCDLTKPLTDYATAEFDLVNAALCLDYIEDWRALFGELWRVIKPHGSCVFSCGHPAFDAEYFKTERYFEVEQIECVWRGFGINVTMPGYRRSVEEVVMPPIDAGFVVERIHEPLPTADFAAADPQGYAALRRRPCFICLRVRKPG